jgi:hypothetical protein
MPSPTGMGYHWILLWRPCGENFGRLPPAPAPVVNGRLRGTAARRRSCCREKFLSPMACRELQVPQRAPRGIAAWPPRASRCPRPDGAVAMLTLLKNRRRRCVSLLHAPRRDFGVLYSSISFGFAGRLVSRTGGVVCVLGWWCRAKE